MFMHTDAHWLLYYFSLYSDVLYFVISAKRFNMYTYVPLSSMHYRVHSGNQGWEESFCWPPEGICCKSVQRKQNELTGCGYVSVFVETSINFMWNFIHAVTMCSGGEAYVDTNITSITTKFLESLVWIQINILFNMCENLLCTYVHTYV